MTLSALAHTNTAPLHSLAARAQLRPTWYSEHSQALAALKDIEHIQVVAAMSRSTRKRTYAIETYRAASKMNRIPTNNQQQQQQLPAVADLPSQQQLQQQQQQKPATAAERSFEEFSDLRSKMYRHVHEAHSSTRCSFCEEVLSEVIFGNANPNGLTKLLIGDARVQQRLAAFLNKMLALTKGCSASRGERLCSGQDMVPLLLHDFLVGQDAAALA